MKQHFSRFFSTGVARVAADYRLQVLLTIGAVVVVASVWYARHRDVESTDNATVGCDVIDVVSEVKGVIETIHFKDDQYVELGAPLVGIEDAAFRAQLARAEAALNMARSSYQRARRSEELLSIELPADVEKASMSFASAAATARAGDEAIEEARQQLNESVVDVAYLKQNYERERDLNAHKAISDRDFESTRHQYEAKVAAHAALAVKVAKLERLREAEGYNAASARAAHATLLEAKDGKLAGARDEGAVARERMAVAQAELDLARLNMEHTTSRAKLAGFVTNRRVSTGEYIEVGQRIASIVACQDKPWVTANFKETQLTRMRAGQRAEFTVDTYPGVVFRGTVESISSGSGSTFSVLPPENATGNFTKVVKRMPVKIRLDGPTDRILRVGASVEVRVFVD